MTSQGLQDWLDVATRDLCADARKRVCEEVKAHYAAAYDALVASGESADVAAAGALASLGGPELAGRMYRRTHLTADDDQILAKLNNRSGALRYMLRFIAVAVIGAIVFWSDAILIWFGWALLSLPVVPYVFAPLNSHPLARLRSVVLVQLCASASQYLFAMCAVGVKFGLGSLVLTTAIWCIGMAPLPLAMTVIWLRLYRKLKRNPIDLQSFSDGL